MNRSSTRLRQQGMSMVELMIALLIGAVIIFGATTVYERSRNSYSDNESIARLQETARYAMSVIEPDIRMSNFFGLVKGASVLSFAGNGLPAQTDPVPPGAPPSTCGNNFALDLNTNLQGDNNRYFLSATRTVGCDTLPDLNTGAIWTSRPQLTSDTLTVRRASVFPSPLTAGVLQICTSRVAGRVFSTAGACAAAPGGQLSNVIVNSYYIDRRSAQSTTYPSLRRKVLSTAGGAVIFADQEVIAGVEDLQVQFGIDPNGVNGTATRYVNPNAVPAGAQVVAVRIWLLVRGETSEAGFTDAQIYQYADRLPATGVGGNLNGVGTQGFAYQPSLSANDTFTGPRHVRRLLISRTIQLRNALGT